MDISKIKEQLISDKLDLIIKSPLVYEYRDVCEYLLATYQKLLAKETMSPHAHLILPMITADNFSPANVHHFNQSLQDKIDTMISVRRPISPKINLVYYTLNEDDLLLQLMTMRHTDLPLKEVKKEITRLDLNKKVTLLDTYFASQSSYAELDFFTYTFELYCTVETYTKLQAADTNALIIQNLSEANGYITPPEILNGDLHGEFIISIKRLLTVYQKARKINLAQACYLLPRAFLQRVLINLSINQLQKLNQAISEDLWDKIRKVHPTIFQGVRKK